MLSTEAVVLHSRRYGDTSRIVVLFTASLGKMNVLAKGARTPKSSFGSALEPLSIAHVHVYHRPQRDLHTIGKAELIHSWKSLTSSLEHLEAALAVCRTVMKSVPAEVHAPDVYKVLKGALLSLDTTDPSFAYQRGVYARLQLADVLGFGARFAAHAVSPSTPMDTTPPPTHESHTTYTANSASYLYISLEDGLPTQSGGYQLSRSAYNLLAQAPYGLTVPAQDKVEVEAFLAHYFAEHLGRG